MPVQYPSGIIAEHNWTRSNAGLFDVSHMGQCVISGSDFQTVAKAIERLVPADVLGLAPRQQRYSQLLSDDGGTLDDLMITRHEQDGLLYVVVNAGRKEHDYDWIEARLPRGMALRPLDGLALVALHLHLHLLHPQLLRLPPPLLPHLLRHPLHLRLLRLLRLHLHLVSASSLHRLPSVLRKKRALMCRASLAPARMAVLLSAM
jgi:hypothetical protein